MPKLISELAEGDRVSGTVRRCHCGALFIGRADARFCSNACRMRETRGQSGPPPVSDALRQLVSRRLWDMGAELDYAETDEIIRLAREVGAT